MNRQIVGQIEGQIDGQTVRQWDGQRDRDRKINNFEIDRSVGKERRDIQKGEKKTINKARKKTS